MSKFLGDDSLLIGGSHFMGSSNISMYNPNVLPLTAWWRGTTTQYAGSPWIGSPSAGTSGSKNLTEATNPATIGPILNTRTSAEFDGLDDQLLNGTTLNNIVSASGWFCWAVFWVDAISTTQVGSNAFNNDALIADSAGFWGIHFGGVVSNRIQIYQFDNAARATEHIVPLGQWNLICATYDGVTISSSLNGSAVESTPSGAISTVTGTMRVGRNFTSQYFDGKIMEIGIKQGSEPLVRFNNIRQYVNNRYNLSI